MKLTLKDGERVFINGAVMQAEGKVTIQILNEADFLLENYVMQEVDATTPIRRLYYLTQAMLITPTSKATLLERFNVDLAAIKSSYIHIQEAKKLEIVDKFVQNGQVFDALKSLKKLFVIDDALAEAARMSEKLVAQAAA